MKFLFGFLIFSSACLGPAFADVPTVAMQIPCQDLLAEPPIDEMGLDFAIEYGRFAQNHQATPGSMLQMAEELFQIRLDLAKRYKTFFAVQMTEPIQDLPYWRARESGFSNRRVFSFGIRDVPRADLVWLYFNKGFRRQGSQETIATADFPLYKGSAQVDGEVYAIPYAPIPNLTFKIFVLSTGQYYLEHAPDPMVPQALKRLQELWDKSLDKSRSYAERWELFAEWEWLWFWTNPFGRAGASIGATLSLLWEADLSQELGHSVWRKSFYHQDLEALSRNLEEYRNWRTRP